MQRLYCLGDSLTFGFGVRRQERWTNLLQEHGWQTVNLGCNGDTTAGMLARLQTVLADQPRGKVLVMGGSNDIFYGGDISGAKANMGAMLQQILSAGFEPVVGIPLPAVAEDAPAVWAQVVDFAKANELLAEYCVWLKRFSVSFGAKTVDFRSDFVDETGNAKRQLFLDGLHPTVEGHKQMAQRLLAQLGDGL